MLLREVAGEWSIAQLPPGAEPALQTRPFATVSTPEEYSLVVPVGDEPEGSRIESPWRMLAVAGPLDFALTGIIARISVTLATAEIPVFVISSFNTDYVLLPADRFCDGVAAIEASGMTVERRDDPHRGRTP